MPILCYLGVESTSMNVHLLYHLPDCVKMWGPLWAYSCFHFESMNGYLKFLFHGTKDMTKQVYHLLHFCTCYNTYFCLQIAFSYIVMQALPQTLDQFSGACHSITTFANLVYGKKRYANLCNLKVLVLIN